MIVLKKRLDDCNKVRWFFGKTRNKIKFRQVMIIESIKRPITSRFEFNLDFGLNNLKTRVLFDQSEHGSSSSNLHLTNSALQHLDSQIFTESNLLGSPAQSVFSEDERTAGNTRRLNQTSYYPTDGNSSPELNSTNPYLMTIEGQADELTTKLSHKQELLVGGQVHCGLQLHHHSICEEHCYIGFNRELDQYGSTRTQMWIRKAQVHAKISINQTPVPDRQIWSGLHHGDIIEFDTCYTGIIVDPTRDDINIQQRINGVLASKEASTLIPTAVDEVTPPETPTDLDSRDLVNRTLIRALSVKTENRPKVILRNKKMNKRPPFATSDFEDDLDEIEGLENLGNTRKMSEEIELQIQEFDGNSLVPEFTLPDSNSSGERALLNFIFKEVTPDKAGSGPFAASLLMATLKSALNQHGIDRYLKLVGNIADLIADYSTKFTNEVKDALEIDNKSIENKSMNSNYDDTSTTSMGTSLQLAQTALPLINKILHFSAFTSDFCQQCKCYLPKLVLSQDDVLLLELQEAHDDLLPLFNNLLQELLISTVVRLIPILQISVGEMFNMNGREVGAPRKNARGVYDGENIIIRNFR
jgi:hypothetical protein